MTSLAGLRGIQAIDKWAQDCLPINSTLTADDARLIEHAFQSKLAEIKPEIVVSSPGCERDSAEPVAMSEAPEISRRAIDKSVLTFPEHRRQRNKIHLRFVAKHPFVVCGRQPCDAHHLRFAQTRGLGLKVSDEFTVPLCRGHHRELHRTGDEAKWWDTRGIDPMDTGRKLWVKTRPLGRSASSSTIVAASERTLPNDETKPIQLPWSGQ